MELMDFYGLWWICWFMFSVLIGYGAKARGRDGRNWFLIAIVLSPPIALIALLAVPDKRREAVRKEALDDVHQKPVQSDPATPPAGSDERQP